MDSSRAPGPLRWAAGLGAVGLGVLGAVEARSIARVRGFADAGGRDHGGAVGEGVGEPLSLVLLGDSAVDGYGLATREALPWQLSTRVSAATGRRVRVRSLAVSGATTGDVAAFQVPLLRAAATPDAVVVGVGVNDVLRRTAGPALAEATRQLVLGVRAAAPAAWLVVVPCPDLARAPGLGPVARRVVGWRCRAVAARQRSVLAEHGVAVVDPGRPGPDLLGEDGLHPGAHGIELLAAALAEAVVA